jgi:hypothetical protein
MTDGDTVGAFHCFCAMCALSALLGWRPLELQYLSSSNPQTMQKHRLRDLDLNTFAVQWRQGEQQPVDCHHISHCRFVKLICRGVGPEESGKRVEQLHVYQTAAAIVSILFLLPWRIGRGWAYFCPTQFLLPFAKGTQYARMAFRCSGSASIQRVGSKSSGLGKTAGSLCIQYVDMEIGVW